MSIEQKTSTGPSNASADFQPEHDPNVIIQHTGCDCEPLNYYRTGGYHPLIVGDLLNGRYEILHKLGYGGTATVWLARDEEVQRNIALKVFTAKASLAGGQKELAAYRHLQSKLPEDQRQLIVPLYDHFETEGPNGKHLCLCLGISGPSLSGLIRHARSMKIRPDVAQQLSLQIAQGLGQIHKAGVIYHDFTPNNILLQLDEAIAESSADQLYERLGQPKSYELKNSAPESEPNPRPSHVYDSLNFTEPQKLGLVKPQVRFIDLAEVGYTDSNEGSRSHGNYDALHHPETLWWRSVQTQASDIWSLACVIFELRACDTLVCTGEGTDQEVLASVAIILGGMPEHWRQKIREQAETDESNAEALNNASGEFEMDLDFDAHFEALKEREAAEKPRGILQKTRSAAWRVRRAIVSIMPSRPSPTHFWIEEGLSREPESLEDTVRSIGTWTQWCKLSVDQRMKALNDMHKPHNTRNVKITKEYCDTGEPPHKALSDEETRDFLDLLNMMLTWERKDRAPIEELLKHKWFITDYASANLDKPWIEKHHPGYEYWSNGHPIF